jgi:hypothetical protein
MYVNVRRLNARMSQSIYRELIGVIIYYICYCEGYGRLLGKG